MHRGILASLGLLAVVAACSQEADLQRARDESVIQAVTAAVSRFQQSHPDVTIGEPAGGWLAAARTATRSNIDWFDCRVHLQQLAERQLASGQATATEYFTSDLIEQGVTGTTFVGVPAADIARASAIWAGAEVDHRIEALRSRDAIATTTQSAVREQAAPQEPQRDTSMVETNPTESGDAVEELAQQVLARGHGEKSRAAWRKLSSHPQ